jgi:hypothetical protein
MRQFYGGKPMPIATRERVANDWVVLGLANTGQSSIGLATGYWLFSFRSIGARAACTYAFSGAGVGVGAGIPFDLAQPQQGATIFGWRGFSPGDLDGAFGMVINAGAGAYGASVGTLRITAFDERFFPYFSYQPVPGPNITPGIGAGWIEGRWMLLSLRDLQTGTFWNAFTSPQTTGGGS